MIKLILRVLLFAVAALQFSLLAVDAKADRFLIAKFDDPADLQRIEWNKENVELSISPRLVTDMSKVLKFTAKQGEYPGFSMYPNKIPKDWSKYETFSFVVWSVSDLEFSIRIDDEKSTNYNTRFNGSANIQKGRTLVQIATKTIGKALDLTRIRGMNVFMNSPPKGLTLHFSDMMLGPLQTAKVEFTPYAERYDLIPTLDVATPHLEFGRNLAKGPIPVFMLSSVMYGREVEELMQRLDLKVSLLSWDREWGANTWGFGDYYGMRGTGTDFSLMQKYLDSSMQGPEKFEAMALYTPVGWNRFSPSARKAIIKRVKEDGEGLVMVMPFPGEAGNGKKPLPWPDDLKEVCALIDSDSDYMKDNGEMRRSMSGGIPGRKWSKTSDHPITRGVPLESLPFENLEVERYTAAPGAEVLIKLESGEPVLAVKQLGKGRVVTIAARALSLTPVMNTPQEYDKKIPYRFWETWYDLETRAILWAAGREFKRDGNAVELNASGENKDDSFSVDQWKDADGKITDWELKFAPPKIQAARVELKAPKSIHPGEKIGVTFAVPNGVQAAGTAWTASLIENADGHWRTLERMPIEAAGANASVELPSTRVKQYIAVVKVEARNAGAVTASGAAEVIVTPDPTWEDYEVHTWLENGLPFLADFEMQRMREFGLTCNTAGPEDFNNCKQLFRHGMRVHGNGLTQGLHPRDLDAQSRAYTETKDKKNLVRHPSYADKDFTAKEEAQVKKFAEGMLPFAPLSLIMSDETALTSYTRDFDYDFHPGYIAGFREKLKEKFGSLEALNAALGTTIKTFEEIQPPTADEAKASGNWGLFNEWRAYNDEMWAGAFVMYEKAMKEKYPQARLSLSGSQESAVFNGIDWARLSPIFGAICGYGGRFQELQRMCFHPINFRATPWGGYGRNGRAVDQQLWSSLLTGGSGMGLFWWLSLRNSDLGFCRSGRDYQRVIAEMRSGIAKEYMQSQRQFSPVAILWSPNSQRISWAQGKFEEFKKVEADTVDSLTAAEFDPYFISEPELAAGELEKRGAKVVVLPMTLSLGTGLKKGGIGEIPALEKFVAGGGMIVAAGAPVCDEFLQPSTWPESLKSKWVPWAEAKRSLAATLAKAGVLPYVTLRAADGGPAKGTSAAIHRLPSGGAALLTLLRAPVGMKEEVGADGVPHSVPDKEGGQEIETITLEAPSFAALKFYDIRAQKMLPAVNGKLTLQMQAGSAYPIALLPYTVDGIEASAAVRDRALSVDWQIKSSAKTLAPHVVRVEVADGKTTQFSANVNCDSSGKGSVAFPLAEEDAGRAFVIRVRDVLSGASAEAKP